MSNELNQQTSELVSKINQAIDVAFEQGAQHMPDVISQILLFGAMKSIFVILPTFGYAFGYTCLLRSRKAPEEAKIVFGISGGCVLIILCAVSCVLFLDLLKIVAAPKLYLLEYAANLVG